jgi:hypothetical protein
MSIVSGEIHILRGVDAKSTGAVSNYENPLETRRDLSSSIENNVLRGVGRTNKVRFLFLEASGDLPAADCDTLLAFYLDELDERKEP